VKTKRSGASATSGVMRDVTWERVKLGKANPGGTREDRQLTQHFSQHSYQEPREPAALIQIRVRRTGARD
jgi:hypothetical protein